MTIAEAIAHFEGFYVPGSRPNRNNNPGDLEFHDWMTKYGAKRSDGRFAIFDTPENGFIALRKLLTFSEYRGKTVMQAINEFAPGNENNTHGYIDFVCKKANITPSTIIDNFI